MAYKDRYKEFEQYLTSGEPGQREKADAWQGTIALLIDDRILIK